MEKSIKAQQILSTVEPLIAGIAKASSWNDSRVYIKPICADRSFRGEQTHQLYIDVESGKLVNQMGKGTCRSEFNAAVRQLVSLLPAKI